MHNQSVAAISKGKPAGVQIITINSAKPTLDHDGNERVIIRDTEGRFWRFHFWQHGSSFKLEPGYGINVPAWKPVDIDGCTFDMASSSTDPL